MKLLSIIGLTLFSWAIVFLAFAAGVQFLGGEPGTFLRMSAGFMILAVITVILVMILYPTRRP